MAFALGFWLCLVSYLCRKHKVHENSKACHHRFGHHLNRDFSQPERRWIQGRRRGTSSRQGSPVWARRSLPSRSRRFLGWRFIFRCSATRASRGSFRWLSRPMARGAGYGASDEHHSFRQFASSLVRQAKLGVRRSTRMDKRLAGALVRGSQKPQWFRRSPEAEAKEREKSVGR